MVIVLLKNINNLWKDDIFLTNKPKSGEKIPFCFVSLHPLPLLCTPRLGPKSSKSHHRRRAVCWVTRCCWMMCIMLQRLRRFVRLRSIRVSSEPFFQNLFYTDLVLHRSWLQKALFSHFLGPPVTILVIAPTVLRGILELQSRNVLTDILKTNKKLPVIPRST